MYSDRQDSAVEEITFHYSVHTNLLGDRSLSVYKVSGFTFKKKVNINQIFQQILQIYFVILFTYVYNFIGLILFGNPTGIKHNDVKCDFNGSQAN